MVSDATTQSALAYFFFFLTGFFFFVEDLFCDFAAFFFDFPKMSSHPSRNLSFDPV